MSLYTVYSMYPEFPEVNDTRTLFSACMPCYLMTEASIPLDEATCKESMFCVMPQALQMMP